MRKACTIVLSGASKDVLNEVERNLHVSEGVYGARSGVGGGGRAQWGSKDGGGEHALGLRKKL